MFGAVFVWGGLYFRWRVWPRDSGDRKERKALTKAEQKEKRDAKYAARKAASRR